MGDNNKPIILNFIQVAQVTVQREFLTHKNNAEIEVVMDTINNCPESTEKWILGYLLYNSRQQQKVFVEKSLLLVKDTSQLFQKFHWQQQGH